jgi:hypothetical protein
VPSQVLPQQAIAVRPAWARSVSNPRGDAGEGWRKESADFTTGQPGAPVTDANFDELEHFYRPAGLLLARCSLAERLAQALRPGATQ